MLQPCTFNVRPRTRILLWR